MQFGASNAHRTKRNSAFGMCIGSVFRNQNDDKYILMDGVCVSQQCFSTHEHTRTCARIRTPFDPPVPSVAALAYVLARPFCGSFAFDLIEYDITVCARIGDSLRPCVCVCDVTNACACALASGELFVSKTQRPPIEMQLFICARGQLAQMQRFAVVKMHTINTFRLMSKK